MSRLNDKQKAKSKEIRSKMSIITTSSINIPPRENHLGFVKCVSISISPEKPATRGLSFTKPIMTDLPPDPLPWFYCDLVCPKPNLPDTPTSRFEVCYIWLKPLFLLCERSYGMLWWHIPRKLLVWTSVHATSLDSDVLMMHVSASGFVLHILKLTKLAQQTILVYPIFINYDHKLVCYRDVK